MQSRQVARRRVADPDDASRTISVPVRRLARWLDGFGSRHGTFSAQPCDEPAGWVLAASDGSVAVVHAPPWLVDLPDDPAALTGIRPVFGALFVRRAGYAVACFAGSERTQAKVGRRHIHGRTAAGGWSQQRYARRRSNQADEIAAAAAKAADRIVVAASPEVAFLVTGGDRPLLADVLRAADPRLARLPIGVHLGMGTPDASVLAGIPDRVLAVQVDLRGPAAP